VHGESQPIGQQSLNHARDLLSGGAFGHFGVDIQEEGIGPSRSNELMVSLQPVGHRDQNRDAEGPNELSGIAASATGTRDMELDRRYLESRLGAGLTRILCEGVESAEREHTHNSGGEHADEQWCLPKMF
jgi:hypothetical protein